MAKRAHYGYLTTYIKATGLKVYFPETNPCPSYPALCVLPKPGGIGRFPRFQAEG